VQNLALAIHGLTLGSIYALVALGFHLIFRAVGVLDFGQGDKVVLGGLVALALLNQHVPLLLAFLIVILGGVAAGVLYDRLVIAPTIRKGHVDSAIIATVGALLVMGNGHVLIWGATGSAFPPLIGGNVTIGGAQVGDQEFLIWGVVAVAVAGVVLFLGRTRYGHGMVAAAADPMAAGTVGIDVRQTRVLAFAIAFGLAGLAGVLIAPLTLAGGTGGPNLTLDAFTAAVLGGLDSTYGVVAGAIILGVFTDLVGGQIPYAYVNPLVYSILILTLLVRPQGLLGSKERLV